MSSSIQPKEGSAVNDTAHKLTTVTSRDGTTIHVQAKGNYHGPHVIFAPGFSTTLAFFDCLFDDPRLYTQLYMVRYDPRGQGLSGKPESPEFYASDRYADDIRALIEAFDLKNPFFAGWSIGAAIAADIAANFSSPLPFSGLIAMAGAVYFDLENIPNIATPLAGNLLIALQDNTDASAAFQTRIDFVESQSVDPANIPFSTKSAWLGGTAYTSPKIASLIAARTHDATRLKEEGKAGWPFLGIEGSEDRIAVKGFMNSMAALFKDHEVHMVQNAGHAVFYDQKDEVVNLLLSFIKRVVDTKPYP